MSKKVVEKSSTIYFCKKCDYKCTRYYDFRKHLSTQKHNEQKRASIILDEIVIFSCECGKKYKHKQNLNRHKKTCKLNENIIIENSLEKEDLKPENLLKEEDFLEKEFKEEKEEDFLEKEFKEDFVEEDFNYKKMLITLINENKELRKQITELIPKIGNNNNNNNNIKQKFNIQIFLNEHCKDAINMTDFIRSVQISLEHLDLTKNKGIAEGLSKAIIENMNKLSIYERPVHCTDIKRETIYVKDDDRWEKDNTKLKIRKAIKDISSKQFKTLQQWMNENPNYQNDENKQDYFVRTLSAIGKNNDNIDNKIIKNLIKETYVNNK
jgi:hypothetical protein